jgi:hypothetical protein
MNVDIDNFHEVLKFIREKKLIKKVIDMIIIKSKYISLDLEFTGVKFDNN